MPRIYISIGSNIDAERHIHIAVDELRKRYGILTISSVYESEPVGFESDNFLNLVVGLETEEDVHNVAKLLHEIEDKYGRDRSRARFSSRTLDLDLLLYGELILNEQGLQLPRVEITKNAFVLWPLAEIAPKLVHPLNQKSISELWALFDKTSQALWPIQLGNL